MKYEPPFSVVCMPINAEGRGPEMDKTKVVKEEWEIWDALNQTVSTHTTQQKAVNALEELQKNT